jgi:hypothetical protein
MELRERNARIQSSPRADLDRFGQFLKTTGWSAIWSVNFAQDRIEDAIVEAEAVANALGDRLLALELGNEVEITDAAKSHSAPLQLCE